MIKRKKRKKPGPYKTRDKKRAIQYICDLFEGSGLYEIQGRNRQLGLIWLKETHGLYRPQEILILIPNFFPYGREFDMLQDILYDRGIYNFDSQGKWKVLIFYKDNKTAFRSLAEKKPEIVDDKRLKNYSEKTIKEIIHLTTTELEHKESLVYYQPRSDDLEALVSTTGLDCPSESLRTYSLVPVHLDYSHEEYTGYFSRKLVNPYKKEWVIPIDYGPIDKDNVIIKFQPSHSSHREPRRANIYYNRESILKHNAIISLAGYFIPTPLIEEVD